MGDLDLIVRNSGVSDLYLPVNTHMYIYRNKIILDDKLYYDSTQNVMENLNSINCNEFKSK